MLTDFSCHTGDGASEPASQGFFLLICTLSLGLSSLILFGISLIPGMGWPVVMSSTICANDVGYGGFSLPGDEGTLGVIGVFGGGLEKKAEGVGGGSADDIWRFTGVGGGGPGNSPEGVGGSSENIWRRFGLLGPGV